MLSLARTAEEYRKLAPKGILLYGSPDGKKVEVALTIAKESGMPLISASLTDVQSDVGKQAGANVHLLFEQARSQFPIHPSDPRPRYIRAEAWLRKRQQRQYRYCLAMAR
jgi:AAA+ superfamily predicted ATPase